MIYERFDVVVGEFPFTDINALKRRPVVVLSQGTFNRSSGHVIGCMITTAKSSSWNSDYRLQEIELAGLKHPCVVRWKVFTLQFENITRKVGVLGAMDREAVETGLFAVLGPGAG